MKHYEVINALGHIIHSGNDIDAARNAMRSYNDRNKHKVLATLRFTDLAISSANSDNHMNGQAVECVRLHNKPLSMPTMTLTGFVSLYTFLYNSYNQFELECTKQPLIY
jgi:hypothetical protein